MRTFIALAILAVTIACVNSESCGSNSDCANGLTMCAANHALICHDRACYCEAQTSNTGSSCMARSDCPADSACHGNHGGAYHCVDGHCRCFRN